MECWSDGAEQSSTPSPQFPLPTLSDKVVDLSRAIEFLEQTRIHKDLWVRRSCCGNSIARIFNDRLEAL